VLHNIKYISFRYEVCMVAIFGRIYPCIQLGGAVRYVLMNVQVPNITYDHQNMVAILIVL